MKYILLTAAATMARALILLSAFLWFHGDQSYGPETTMLLTMVLHPI